MLRLNHVFRGTAEGHLVWRFQQHSRRLAGNVVSLLDTHLCCRAIMYDAPQDTGMVYRVPVTAVSWSPVSFLCYNLPIQMDHQYLQWLKKVSQCLHVFTKVNNP